MANEQGSNSTGDKNTKPQKKFKDSIAAVADKVAGVAHSIKNALLHGINQSPNRVQRCSRRDLEQAWKDEGFGR